MSEERIPIDTVLPGFRLHALDHGWTPLQAFVLVKSLDETGTVTWSYRTSEPFNLEELLGALTIQVEILTRRLAQQWDAVEGDDD